MRPFEPRRGSTLVE